MALPGKLLSYLSKIKGSRVASSLNKMKGSRVGEGVKRVGNTASKVKSKMGSHIKNNSAKYAIGGVAATVAGTHAASYKYNKKRAQKGKPPSMAVRGVSGNMGYSAGMKKVRRTGK